MRIAGKMLPPRPKTLQRILVIGDTGCRITWYTDAANMRGFISISQDRSNLS
jgi:hypothetical protein